MEFSQPMIYFMVVNQQMFNLIIVQEEILFNLKVIKAIRSKQEWFNMVKKVMHKKVMVVKVIPIIAKEKKVMVAKVIPIIAKEKKELD